MGNNLNNWELWKTIYNHDDVSDLQVVALKRDPRSELDESSKRIFPVVAVYPKFPVVLNSLKSDFAFPS